MHARVAQANITELDVTSRRPVLPNIASVCIFIALRFQRVKLQDTSDGDDAVLHTRVRQEQVDQALREADELRQSNTEETTRGFVAQTNGESGDGNGDECGETVKRRAAGILLVMVGDLRSWVDIQESDASITVVHGGLRTVQVMDALSLEEFLRLEGTDSDQSVQSTGESSVNRRL